MDWEELRDHHHGLDGTRTLLQVDGRRGGASPTRSSRCSWATTSSRRKHFIQTNAQDVRFLDI